MLNFAGKIIIFTVKFARDEYHSGTDILSIFLLNSSQESLYIHLFLCVKAILLIDSSSNYMLKKLNMFK